MQLMKPYSSRVQSLASESVKKFKKSNRDGKVFVRYVRKLGVLVDVSNDPPTLYNGE